VKCSECQKRRERRYIYIEGSSVTNMAIDEYYDEDGHFHRHDPNTILTKYSGSKGRSWSDKYQHECSTCERIGGGQMAASAWSSASEQPDGVGRYIVWLGEYKTWRDVWWNPESGFEIFDYCRGGPQQIHSTYWASVPEPSDVPKTTENREPL
jgi:hypothetical protein